MTSTPPVRRLPPLKSLRTLEAIYLAGSVTGAAQQLRVSHSAVSHQVKVLEDWSDTPLFKRGGRSTVLTDAGRSLAMTAHRAFDEVRHEVDRLPLRRVDPVTVATLPLLATELILPNQPDFARAHPEVRLHISMAFADRPTMAKPDVQVLFLRRAAVLASDEILFPGDAIPACSPRLVQSSGLSPAELLEAGPHIHDEDLRMWPAWISAHRPDAQTTLVGDAAHLLLEGSALLQSAVLQGLGVGFVRCALVAQHLESGALLPCSDRIIDHDWVYVLRVTPERAEEGAVQAVVRWLLRVCRDDRSKT
ncbi:LysR family transcriptional regulator [Thalassorhabdomicrobium marinisediminis]|uniref:HTH lysR-type domain-containing protein n=1 Tax=Thalassorhabdomicrobium marinisediminis TaxID=2170577 RepID=A0A2T7FTI8_9RHOB|nr:LysR family transcriptional regulator [Thalassorhabdomicrobium marinisediminis]PVA05488.1 hypothetical protein DC363_14680 [Thalassorhabdomicrobium marinisediminis]